MFVFLVKSQLVHTSCPSSFFFSFVVMVENPGDQVSQLSSAVATAVARALQQQIPTESGPSAPARCECRVSGGIAINRSSITPNR